MAKRNSKIPKNDFEYDEGEVISFTDEAPIVGECISSFSFDDDCDEKTIETNPGCETNAKNTTATTQKNEIITPILDDSNNKINIQSNTSDPIKTKNISTTTKDIFDNRRTPVANGAAPPIDGETPNIKRSYTLRSSTIRKINELKSIHPDINVCVSSIVDIAIEHYHNHIVNEGGTQY